MSGKIINPAAVRSSRLRLSKYGSSSVKCGRASMPCAQHQCAGRAPDAHTGTYVWGKTELVVGGDDKHLDFRIWISIQPSLKGSEVTVSTLVKINNLFGRVYLFIIMPFHKLLTRSLLERAVNRRD
ncbi:MULTISPECIES: DUF2867 domain-containing protein [unclassified Janthinobacterium]|uniref:DUF2867 domain-containing protein n=1 Tax=unclassified Janthinobacterium TaxID=2610881 RepID=UPI002713A212|nr:MULTISPECIES: DUF2867 domain-containing protein [unclassified Janthinobacterium]MDO8065265.1 DUF2867 domain-containing protein [Janthinobacterium sp. SUN206]MDO8071622.1 DUF2867 domain-containing protein [Janthinobacterium sp. SUN176]